jgi:hypothetical protein
MVVFTDWLRRINAVGNILLKERGKHEDWWMAAALLKTSSLPPTIALRVASRNA